MRKIYYYIRFLSVFLILFSYPSCKKEQSIKTKYSIEILPNPCDDFLSVYLTLNTEENVKINLLDKEVFNKTLSAGGNIINIDMTGKNSGLYYLEVGIGNYVDRIKILKN